MVNILLIVAGVFIGFFSICFRRILSAIIGFVLGGGLGSLIAVLIDFKIGIGTAGNVIIMLIFAVLIAYISYKYYRFFVFLNTFLVSFFVFYILAAAFKMDGSENIAIIFAIVAGIVGAILYDPLFIISTAFFGGALMSLGGVSLFNGTNFMRLIGGSGSESIQVTIWTMIFSIAGIIVQFMLLKKLNIGDFGTYNAKHYSSNKKCRQCGNIYSGSLSSCPKCNFSLYEETNQRIDVTISPIVAPINANYGDTWTCKKCNEINLNTAPTCKGCGAYK
jgi:hypothetical protein